MPQHFAHARMLPFPFGVSPAGGRLEALRREQHGARLDLVMDYRALHLTTPPRLYEAQGKPHERLQGEWLPRRLRFSGVDKMEWHDWCAHLDEIPPEHPLREFYDFLCFRTFEGENFVSSQ